MKITLDISQTRLYNQQLTAPKFENPEDVVSWFGAIQAQDFAAAKWALSLRSKNQTDASIEQAFNEGRILRTHVMRPTWHFVTPKDIPWLLTLTSPQVQRFNGSYYRKSGLDKIIFQKSNDVIRKALEGSNQLTRSELNEKLIAEKIPTDHLGLSFTIMQAELDGIIISGPRKGKQFTYMLLEERIPIYSNISHDEALEKLTKRYFQSHGPAQVRDFSWWSGLRVTDAKKGIEMLGSKINKKELDGKTYWYVESSIVKPNMDNGFLVPGFDEYFIAYKDRHDILDKQYTKHLNQGGGMVNDAVIVNGKMVGGWKRTFSGKAALVTIKLFEKISEAQQQSIGQQAKRFGKFLNMPIVIK